MLIEILIQKQDSILKRWLDMVLDTYPADTAKFLKRQKDQFQNPVGYTIAQSLKNIFKALVNGTNPDRLISSLDDIIRIRSVQNFTSAEAVAFIMQLKRVIRQELTDEVPDKEILPELQVLENKIDELTLQAFDIYMKCREKIYQIRADETKKMSSKILERANMRHKHSHSKKMSEDDRT